MLVSSIQLNSYIGHFHGVLDGLRPTFCCCHGVSPLLLARFLLVPVDCKQNPGQYTAPCWWGLAQVLPQTRVKDELGLWCPP